VLYSEFPLPDEHPLIVQLDALRAEIEQALRIEPERRPIHVYLFGSRERYDEFIQAKYPDFPERRAFFVETGRQFAVYAYWGEYVLEDLRHEVAHGYLHAAIPKLPLWLDEGLAEYFEVPPSQRGLNRPHAEMLRAKLREGSWRPNLARLEQLSSVAEMQQVDYAEAWAWTHLLLSLQHSPTKPLHDYLAQLRSGSEAPPLSEFLATRYGSPEPWLTGHLAALPEAKIGVRKAD